MITIKLRILLKQRFNLMTQFTLYVMEDCYELMQQAKQDIYDLDMLIANEFDTIDETVEEYRQFIDEVSSC